MIGEYKLQLTVCQWNSRVIVMFGLESESAALAARALRPGFLE